MSKTTSIAHLAKLAAKNDKDVTAIIETAAVVVTAANELLKEAKPILDTVDTDAIAQKAKDGVHIATERAGKAGRAAKDAAGNAAGTVSGVFAKLGDARDGIVKDLAEARSEKELRNAIRDARQSVLENATTTMTVSEYWKVKEKSSESPVSRISDLPGCFAFATYRKRDIDKDLTDYTGIYIGHAENAAQGVALAMSKEGDADVYADVKFKQNVRIFVYNCMPEDIDERYRSLLQTFADERLYN